MRIGVEYIGNIHGGRQQRQHHHGQYRSRCLPDRRQPTHQHHQQDHRQCQVCDPLTIVVLGNGIVLRKIYREIPVGVHQSLGHALEDLHRTVSKGTKQAGVIEFQKQFQDHIVGRTTGKAHQDHRTQTAQPFTHCMRRPQHLK